MRYKDLKDGQWVMPEDNYKIMCCDCKLVHDIEFRITNGSVEFRAFRNKRATAAARRRKK